MSTETTNKKIKIDNGTTFGRTYTDKAVDERLQGLVSTSTFTPVKEKANNSLQKPVGLTKTKLVGVGINGQDNIEIGDNLTLTNGKLSATGGASTLYCHYIAITKFSDANAIGYIGFNYYNNSSDELNDLTKITSALADKFVLCSGFVKNSATNKFMDVLDVTASDGNLIVELFYTIDGLVGSDIIDSTYDIMDTVFQVA